MTRELFVTWPETKRFQSPKRSASAALRRKLETLTPAAPWYVVALVLPAARRLLLGDLGVDDRVAAEALAEVHAGVRRVELACSSPVGGIPEST